MRRHLSYANIMATIAVFIALGGSSFAAIKFSGANIKNRSVSSVDIKKNSLTGTEVKESSLGQVPKSLSALRADLAAKATTATTAGSAATAGSATTALNATRLGGNGASAFLSSSALEAGDGNLEATSPATVLNLSKLKVLVTTDGDADANRDIRFDNNLGGTAIVNLGTQTGVTAIPAGTDLTLTGQPAVAQFSVSSAATAGLGYHLLCSFQDTSPKRVYCKSLPF